MTEQYRVTLHSQMGPRQGTLTLQYEGDQVQGSLELIGHRNPVRGARTADGTLHLSHSIQTAVSTISCRTVLEIRQGQLTGETDTYPCRTRWEGARVSDAPGQPVLEEPRRE